MTKALIAHKVSHSEICIWLIQLPKSDFGEYLRKKRRKIFEAHSTYELLYHLSFCWDWWNYEVLEAIAKRFVQDDTKKQMEDYIHKLQNFQKRTKVRDIINKQIGLQSLRGMDIEIEVNDKEWLDRTLEDVVQLSNKFSRISAFLKSMLIFRGIERGCVVFSFVLLPPVDTANLNLEQEMSFFQAHHLLKVLIDGTCVSDIKVRCVCV